VKVRFFTVVDWLSNVTGLQVMAKNQK